MFSLIFSPSKASFICSFISSGSSSSLTSIVIFSFFTSRFFSLFSVMMSFPVLGSSTAFRTCLANSLFISFLFCSISYLLSARFRASIDRFEQWYFMFGSPSNASIMSLNVICLASSIVFPFAISVILELVAMFAAHPKDSNFMSSIISWSLTFMYSFSMSPHAMLPAFAVMSGFSIFPEFFGFLK